MNPPHLLAPSARPIFSRSRSHTTGSNRAVSAEEAAAKPTRPPSSGRSSSYLSPAEPKSHEVQSLPVITTTKAPHIRRHGQNKDGHVHRHRHTQSEAHRPKKDEKSDAVPHLMAGLAAERARHEPEKLRAADFLLGPRAHELKRMTSTRSNRPAGTADGRPDLGRRRATSDPKEPSRRIKTPIEIALENADARKRAKRAATTQKDIERMQERAQEAEDELRGRLADIGQTSTEITRRLDYTYYSLLERLGSLVSTIHSFQSLSTQSRALVENFSTEAENLDTDIKRKMRNFRQGFDERGDRVTDLEQRGVKAGNKAVQLGRRLENARTVVDNWEKREKEVRKRRSQMFKGTWWTLVSVLGAVILLLLWKEWRFGADAVVQRALEVPPEGHSNKSLQIDADLVRRTDIPDEVKTILDGIEARRRMRGSSLSSAPSATSFVRTVEREDERLRALDEL